MADIVVFRYRDESQKPRWEKSMKASIPALPRLAPGTPATKTDRLPLDR
jgi:hypothetical protein